MTTPAVVTSKHLLLYRLQETRGLALEEAAAQRSALSVFGGAGTGTTPPTGSNSTSPVGVYQVFGGVTVYAQGLMDSTVWNQLIDGDWTIAFRFQMSAAGSGTGIMVTVCGPGSATNDNNFILYIGAGSRVITIYQFQSTSSNTPITCSGTITTGVDHVLVVSRKALGSNQFQYTAYLDNAQFNQVTATGHTVRPNPTQDYLTLNGYVIAGGIGTGNATSGNIWSVAELQLFNFCVTPAQASQIYSGPSAPGTPAPTAVAGDGFVTLSWPTPTWNLADVSSYTVTTSPATSTTTVIGSATGVTIAGLTNGQPYTFSVVANSLAGSSAAGTVTSSPVAPPTYAVPLLTSGGSSPPLPTKSAGVDFGTDVSTFPKVDTTFSTISGFRVLAEALARRLLTRRGLLTFHPDYGRDMREYNNESIDDAALARLKQEAAQELRQDERVADADATVTYTSGTLAVSCKVVTASGPFSFVLSLSKLDVQLYIGAT